MRAARIGPDGSDLGLLVFGLKTAPPTGQPSHRLPVARRSLDCEDVLVRFRLYTQFVIAVPSFGTSISCVWMQLA